MGTDHNHHELLRGLPYKTYILGSMCFGSRAKSL